jgi:3-oxoacyl-[acyl-carrier protein] reductase
MRKSVVVTGCSKGLGRHLTESLIANGYAVIGISRTKPSSFDQYFTHYVCDLSDSVSVVETANLIQKEFKSIYALVNNAANGTDGLLPTQHNSEISQILQTNLLAPILLAKYFSRSMLLQRDGRIINISSVVASTGYRGLSVYAASKGGLVSFSRSLARDLGPANITVNAILPGFMESEMTSGISKERFEKIRARSPLNSLAEFKDISEMVLYLLSENASKITGTTLTIDAGNSA